MNKLKLLKILVVILTFLIVFGMLSALGIIYQKVRAPENKTSTVSLSQPRGTTIEKFQILDKHMYILAKKGGLADRIIILNLRQPQEQTVININ